MIRRPLFLGTLGFCGAILVSCFLGKAAALSVLGVLTIVWWQNGSKAKSRDQSEKRSASETHSPEEGVCQPEADIGPQRIRMQRLRLRKHGAAILLIFYAVSFANFQLYGSFCRIGWNGGCSRNGIKQQHPHCQQRGRVSADDGQGGTDR